MTFTFFIDAAILFVGKRGCKAAILLAGLTNRVSYKKAAAGWLSAFLRYF
jgi:hypothetical protein